jgi:hypothetical protein
MDQETRAELENLHKQLTLLSSPLEDTVAYRVAEKAQNQIKKSLLAWGAMATAVLLLAGYSGYRDVVQRGRQDASEFVRKQALTELQPAMAKVFDEVREKVKQEVLKRSLEDSTKLEGDLATIVSNAQATVDARLTKFAAEVGTAVKDPKLSQAVSGSAPPVAQGFAYYGIRSDEGWVERNFKRASGVGDALPKPGDVVVALKPVNAARSDQVRFFARLDQSADRRTHSEGPECACPSGGACSGC